MKLTENERFNTINTGIYKVRGYFCLSSSVGEYSLAYNF